MPFLHCRLIIILISISVLCSNSNPKVCLHSHLIIVIKWSFFSEERLTSAIAKYNNSSTSELDKLSWRHLKKYIKKVVCLKKIINITNICIESEYWPSYFKVSTTITISKPNKKSYNTPKAFCPIILLNTIRNFFLKFIRKRLQFQVIFNNFCCGNHLSQWQMIT